ncbi:transposase, Ptta/En/Spm [Tanacetum coccineum]|uniref:Transposase, Ptta/En/Spm n=1 Tax=Tanacetum coccineum TaxID=301880 RepID=A0ABQ4X151_9ASTR
MVLQCRCLSLQQLPFSPATKPGYPGRLVAGDAFPGRYVARDKLSGKARRGYVPERLTRATTPGPRGFSQAIKCHRGGFTTTGNPLHGATMTLPFTILNSLPFSQRDKTGVPVRLSHGDAFPGRYVARDKLSGKARRGYVPERLTRATTPGPRGFSQAIKCHRGGSKRDHHQKHNYHASSSHNKILRFAPSWPNRKEDDVVGCTQMNSDIHNATFQSDLHPDTPEEQASNLFAKQYYEMLEADVEPLYEGCQNFSTLEAATRMWNTSRWKKKSNVARQNRLTEVDGEVSKHTAGSKTILQHKFQMEKEKKRPVSLLEAYHRTHTSTNVSSEASGSGMDEASEGRTREYVTASSKRVADAVEAAIVDKLGPDASEHPSNDFDLWGEATGGRKKGKLVGLGTRGDQRVMVTRTAATSSSSSTSNEQVQTLEEIIRRLQEENTQIRSQNQREMQIEIQRRVEHQVLEHMRQRELEANAHEQA